MAYRRDRTAFPHGAAGAILWGAGVALLLGTPTAEAAAQQVPSPYEFFDHRFEVSAGLQHWETRQGEFDLGPQSGTGPSVRVGMHLSGPFSLEGFGSIVPTTRTVVDPGVPADEEGPQPVGESDALLVSAEVRARFHVTGDRTWYGLAPYVSAGPGLSNDFRGLQDADEGLAEDDRFDFGPSLTFFVGAGTQWHPGDRFLVQADLGITAWRLSNPDGFRALEGAGEFESVDENEWVFNPGFTVTLGLRR